MSNIFSDQDDPIHFHVYIVKCTLHKWKMHMFHVNCTLHITHIVYCMIRIVHCLLPIAHCLLPIANCPLYIDHCPLLSAHNEQYSLHYTNAQCTLHYTNAQCILHYAHFILHNAHLASTSSLFGIALPTDHLLCHAPVYPADKQKY